VSSISNLRAIIFSLSGKLLIQQTVFSLGTYSYITYWNCSQNNSYSPNYGASMLISYTRDLLFIAGCWRHFFFWLFQTFSTHLAIASRKTWMKRYLDSALQSRIIYLGRKFEEATSAEQPICALWRERNYFPLSALRGPPLNMDRPSRLAIRDSEYGVVRLPAETILCSDCRCWCGQDK